MNGPEPQADDLAELLRERVLDIVRQEDRDLTLRQFAVLLLCYSAREPQTVRGLAQHLGTAKAPITRGADRLEEAGLAERRVDPADRRSVLITATPAGKRYVATFFGNVRTVTGNEPRR
jgi:DNA-binding MarR family transcriptional regulator